MEHGNIIDNIIQVRNSKGLTKRSVAAQMEVNEATYGRIESGKIALSYNDLAKIAGIFEMSIIDLITWPKRYVPESNEDKVAESSPKVTLHIELSDDNVKADVIKLAFGDRAIEVRK